jgi:hypothetical protein
MDGAGGVVAISATSPGDMQNFDDSMQRPPNRVQKTSLQGPDEHLSSARGGLHLATEETLNPLPLSTNQRRRSLSAGSRG